MQAEQISRRYAAALFGVVTERNMLARAEEELGQLDVLLRADPTLMKILQAPDILDQEKESLLRRVFANRLSPVFIEFMQLLLDKHRIVYLHGIIEHFLGLAAEARGQLTARVTTAVTLTDDERNRLIEQLQTKTAKKIELEETVDPRLVGGVIVILKDEIIDGSVRYQLSQLRDELMKATTA
ncbi:MAG: F0F1 ATP synthase subunit delta [candidate division Zixibacteria bacterium]|nr:F0F1 ATP synthase subunit delta [candidate division Zixibacteria bacterium]